MLSNQSATRDELATAAEGIANAIAALKKAPTEGGGSTTGDGSGSGNTGTGSGNGGTGSGNGTGNASKGSGDATSAEGLPETGDHALPAALGLGALGAVATAIGVKHMTSVNNDEA